VVALPEFALEFAAMASRCEVRLCAPDEASAEAWGNAAIAEVRRIEAKYSRFRDDSVTSRINRTAGGEAIEVDDETAALLDFSASLFRQSGGRFDPTAGVLRRVWDFKSARVPDQAELDALLPLIGWQQVEWRRPYVRLPRGGMEIDFGGIGKEYAADRASAAIQSHGARHGFVDLGGDLNAFGARPRGGPWRVAVRHPRDPARGSVGAIDLTRGAVATSGDYERFFERDGRRYCHLLDPRTGWPAAYWQSISVAAPVCVAAGACATIAMLMPVDEALAFLRAQAVEFLAVDASGAVVRG